MVGKLNTTRRAQGSTHSDDPPSATPLPSRGAPPSNNTLTLHRRTPAGDSPHPLPLHSWDPPVAPLREVSRGPLNRLRTSVARLGRRTERIVAERRADTPPANPTVTIRLPLTLPPRHPASLLQASAEKPSEPVDEAEPSIDEGEFRHGMTVIHADPLEDRMKELEVRRTRLVRLLQDWSWSPGDSFEHQTALGVLMNMKMAANPCRENAAVRDAGIRHLNEEISRVDKELAPLAVARRFADLNVD